MLFKREKNPPTYCHKTIDGNNFFILIKNNLKGKSKKGRMEIGNRRGTVTRGLFFFISLFKTTEICFGSPKWEFCTGKKHFALGKNRKNDFAPSEKYSSYAYDDICNVHVRLL